MIAVYKLISGLWQALGLDPVTPPSGDTPSSGYGAGGYGSGAYGG